MNPFLPVLHFTRPHHRVAILVPHSGVVCRKPTYEVVSAGAA